VVEVTIRSDGAEDMGFGIVIQRCPLTLLVPLHVIDALEDDTAKSIILDNTIYSTKYAKILHAPALAADELAVVRLRHPVRRAKQRVYLTKSPSDILPGQDLELHCKKDARYTIRTGNVVNIKGENGRRILQTDVPVEPGSSGSAVTIGGILIGVCMGMMPAVDGGRGTAIVIPFSHEALAELRRLRSVGSLAMILRGCCFAVPLLIGIMGLVLYSWYSFRVGSIEIATDESHIAVRNSSHLTLRQIWTRVFDTPVKRVLAYSEQADADASNVVVGTWYEDGKNGSVSFLDRFGRVLWSYSVPDGECIYSTTEETYDGYSVDVIYQCDLDRDGENELLVSFVHETWFPCKLVVFSAKGEVIAEYWHHGYIRTLFASTGNGRDLPMLVVSASNNGLRTEEEWWNPQVIFAFEGLKVAGQSPPYLGLFDEGSESWYYKILNVDPEVKRAKCYNFEMMDFDADGTEDIRASLTDGRFYYLAVDGATLGMDFANSYIRDFGNAARPDLIPVQLRQAANREDVRSTGVREYSLPTESIQGGMGGDAPSNNAVVDGEGLETLHRRSSPIIAMPMRCSREDTTSIDGFCRDSIKFQGLWTAISLDDGEQCKLLPRPLDDRFGIEYRFSTESRNDIL